MILFSPFVVRFEGIFASLFLYLWGLLCNQVGKIAIFVISTISLTCDVVVEWIFFLAVSMLFTISVFMWGTNFLVGLESALNSAADVLPACQWWSLRRFKSIQLPATLGFYMLSLANRFFRILENRRKKNWFLHCFRFAQRNENKKWDFYDISLAAIT